MFEKATKQKLRFLTPVGALTTEDLWDLPLTSTRGVSLDALAKNLNREVKACEEESFVVQESTQNSVLSLKFGIVKHVIKAKLANAEKAEKAAATRVRNERILSVLVDKEHDDLNSKSVEELKELLAG